MSVCCYIGSPAPAPLHAVAHVEIEASDDQIDDVVQGRPPYSQTNEVTKLQILHLHGQGKSYREIGRIVGSTHKVVSRVVRRFLAQKTIDRKKGSGRPRKTSPQTDRMIVRTVAGNRFTAISQISESLVLGNLSESTISRRIRETGDFNSYWAVRKPYIRDANIKKRLAWCKARVSWTVEQWEQFLWTDESPYVLRFRAKRRVWRRHNERYAQNCLQGSVKHDIKINVWGCFSAHGVGSLCLVDGILDQHQYMDILLEEMLPSAENLFGEGRWVFQQDNDPKHTAIRTRNWFIEHQVPLSEWPAQSPDLNPIENLWSILDKKCAKRSPSNARELYEILEKEWYNLDVELLKRLVHSMPRRCQAVIDNKGGMTKY